ncbi:MAG: glycosyltransferase family 2 protein [Bacteroidales bacterium]|jgi:GT2 family glycosyltransferase|nr:glycosyltransferase family 2 protein [Bacteroidales bacterium]
MQKLSVVILNWNGKEYLEKFLPSLLKYTPSWAEIVIADNASTDASLLFLEQNYPQLRVIINAQNYGFAKGYNVALAQIKSQYYCLLNSDIEVCDHWVEPIVEYLDTHPQTAICQPKLLAFNQKDEFEYAGAAGGFIDKFGYPFCRGRLFSTLEKDKGQYDDIKEIFWATGACMFVRSEIYHQLGGLDDDFFAHMEEIDFCWRAKNEKHKVMYIPDSVVYHIGGGTLPKKSPQKTFLNFRNNIILLYKNLPKRRLLWVFAVRWVLDMVAALRFLTDSGWGDCVAVFKAHLAFYKSLPKNINKRTRIKHHFVSQIYKKSIVLEYYLRKKKYFSDLNAFKFSKLKQNSSLKK